jgi:DNA polymerase III subunit beta
MAYCEGTVKFRCERDVLVEAFSSAARAVSTRSALPVLSCVRLQLSGDQLRLAGSDLDLTIEVEVSVSGEDNGVAVLPAKLGADILRAMEAGAIHVSVEGEQATIRAGRSVFSVRTLNAEEFPKLPDVPVGGVTIQADQFADAAKQVIASASHDDARPILTGVLMAAEAGGLRLVATDSYRLSVRDLPGTTVLAEGQTVLVPSRALAEVARVLGSKGEITLHLGDREASFVVGATKVTTRLIEGQYPPYRNLIPASLPNILTVQRSTLQEALRRVRLLAKDATPVRLKLGGDSLELVAVTQDVGQANEDVEAAYVGTEMTVAFNPDFLIAGVEAAAGETITLETIDNLKPAVLRCAERPDFLYLLMPVRV